MATTRKKPAAATRAVAAPKAATRAVATRPSEAEAPAPVAARSGTAVLDAPKALAPAPGAPSGIERRRSVREKLVAPAVLQPSSGDASVDRGVQVQDLSLGGVGFVASEKFDPGEVYRITLGKGPLLLNARVRIVSCNKTAHRMYRCGAEFC
jgi:hypothetical protein